MSQKTSAKIIVLETTQGSFDQGFSVSIQISDRGKAVHQTLYGQLPPAPEIPGLYQKWQSVYRDDYSRSVSRAGSRIIVPPAQIKNVASSEERRNAGDALILAMQRWLQQDGVRDLEYALRDELEKDAAAQLILKTDDELMQRLPWHRWSLFRRYDKLAMALHMPYPATGKPLKWPVRILAILGNAEPDGDIDVQQDRQMIESLPRAEVTVLNQPSRRQFSDALRDRQGWDIVFFAGHSESQFTTEQTGRPDGVLHINSEDSLSLTELNQALKTATQNGLQLLILNSCDGLGIAHSIAEVRIPYSVVMREPVPDKVAHAFLRYLLDSFSNGEALHRSLRIARDRLDEGLKKDFPSASWLPVVCQHPSAPLLCWPTLWQPPTSVKWGLAAGTVGLAAIAVFAFQGLRAPSSELSSPAPDPQALGNDNRSLTDLRLSQGAEILVRSSTPSQAEQQSADQKKLGTVAYAEADYETAIARFEKALALWPNSPEALIYKNNAQAQLQAQTQGAETLTLGVPLPMTADPNAALEIMRGVAQAQEEINQAGGIQGRQLEILLADDGDDPALARRLAQNFSENPAVVAVIGSNTSDSSLASLDAYREGQLPVISPTSTAVELSDASDFFFRTVPSDAVAAQALATHAFEQLGARRAAVYFNPNSRYSTSLQTSFEQSFTRLGGEVVKTFDATSIDFDPERSLARAAQSKTDVVALFPNHSVLERSADVLSANQGKLPVLGGDGLYSPKTLSLAKGAGVGTVVSVPWHIDNSPDPDFPARSLQLWGGARVNWRSAMAYDAVLAIASAAQKTPTRAGIQQALSSRKFELEGASGEVTFEGGDRQSQTQLVEIIAGENGQPQFSPVR